MDRIIHAPYKLSEQFAYHRIFTASGRIRTVLRPASIHPAEYQHRALKLDELSYAQQLPEFVNTACTSDDYAHSDHL